MSYDFALERPCTHEVKFERVARAGDIPDAVRIPRPPASQLVSLYVDGELVPRSGLMSRAEIAFSRPGPYRLTAGKSDLLHLRVPGQAARMVPLLTGGAVPASDLARDLSRKVPELSFRAEGAQVVVSARSASPGAAFSFPDPRWTDRSESMPSTARALGAFAQLGIVPGRVVSAREVFPAWKLERDWTSPLEAARIIVLQSPMRNSEVVLHVGYFTDAAGCRRCRGSKIEFDYGVVNGSYETVDGSDLMLQEFDKFLFTRAGSHFKWPWLGSRLVDRIGGKGNAMAMSPLTFINVDITQAFRTYQNIKSQQDSGLQDVSDAEYPYALGPVSVQSPPSDPTIAVVTTSIMSRSREPVVLKRVVGNPDPFHLASGGQAFKLRG